MYLRYVSEFLVSFVFYVHVPLFKLQYQIMTYYDVFYHDVMSSSLLFYKF